MNLNEAAVEVGVSASTLRRWLQVGMVADVNRDTKGRRVFSNLDIQRLREYAFTHIESKKKLVNNVKLNPGFPSTNYTVASFFSGIGGFDIGFENAGFSVTMQCEIEPFCNRILEKHWPNVPRFNDIKDLNNADIPSSDVWVGGFPCQDLSLARMGKRDGLRGSKSGLFYQFAELIGKCKPRVIVLENVAGILSSHEGRDFGIVISALAKLGYSVGWRTFNSYYFGVPQSRQRVFIVGCLGDGAGPGKILFEPECSEGNHTASRQNGKKIKTAFQEIVGDPFGAGPVIQSVAYCLYATSARHTGTDWSRNYVSYPLLGKVRRLVPSECEGVMAFPPGWTLANKTGLTGDDLDSARYHALGNAVTPPVAEWLATKIRDYLSAADHESAKPEIAPKPEVC